MDAPQARPKAKGKNEGKWACRRRAPRQKGGKRKKWRAPKARAEKNEKKWRAPKARAENFWVFTACKTPRRNLAIEFSF